MKCLAYTISPQFQETQTGILGTFNPLFKLQYSCYMIIRSNQHESYCTMQLLVNTTLHQTNEHTWGILSKKYCFFFLCFFLIQHFFPRTSQSYNVTSFLKIRQAFIVVLLTNKIPLVENVLFCLCILHMGNMHVCMFIIFLCVLYIHIHTL